MKYIIRRTNQFKRDIKKILKAGCDIEKLLKTVEVIANGQELPIKYKDHPLKGKSKGKRDCPIEPDWLLIYALEDNELVLYRTGSHSDLFKK